MPFKSTMATVAVVAGSSAALLTWGATTEGRMALAARDLDGLGDQPDPAAIRLLDRVVHEERPDSALTVLTALSGGDPLKAAVAAGQTPSPSAVAAAPVVGVLAPKWAWTCAAVVLASLALVFGIGAPFSAFERVGPPPYPPAMPP